MSEVTPNDMPGVGAATEPSEPAEQTKAVPAKAEAKAAPPNPTETVDFWKKKAREQEQRAKSNYEDAQKYRELKGDKDDYDPRVAIENLQKDIESERTQRIRAEVGRDYPNVPLKYIGGDTEEDMRASAEELKSLLEAQKAQRTAPAAAPAAEVTSDKKVEGQKQLGPGDLKNMTSKQILEARNNGQLEELMGNKQ